MTGDGRRYRLTVDEHVRTAVRRTRPAPAPGPDDRVDRPGPREVQARIRAGADAEQVAAQTGLDVDFVRRFEGPVLAERAHVSEVARASAVDRGDPALSLERVVLDVLTSEGYDASDVRWDSHKVDGTRWNVVARARTKTTSTAATWSFDTGTRSLEAADAAAERLTGAERRRRLSAVRDTVFDVERPATGAGRARGGTVDLLDTLARQRGRRPVPPVPTPEPTEAPDEPTTGEVPVPEAVAEVTDGPGATGDAVQAPEADRTEPTPEDLEGMPEDPPVEPSVPAEATAPPATRRQGRGQLGLVRAVADPEPAGHDDRGEGDRATDLSPAPSIEPDLLSELDLDVPLARPEPAGTRPAGTPDRATGTSGPPTPERADRRPRRRRAAVPSWDEIVFGAKRDD
jgi:hypothetical protein